MGARSGSLLPSWFTTFILGAFCALGAVALGAWLHKHFSPNLRFAANELTQRLDHRAGPWGELDALKIPLASIDEIAQMADERSGKPHWVFENCTKSQLIRYFQAADLRSRERAVLLNQRYWTTRSNGCEISPPESVVYALDQGSRTRLYAVLAKSEFNSAQRWPFRFAANRFQDDLRGIGLEGAEIMRLENLTYSNATTVCLADLGIAKRILKKSSFENFVELLYSTPAYRLRVHVNPDSDADALAAYWGRGGREKQIRPLLKSLTHVPGGAHLNVLALLPEFARDRLYTYPDDRDDPNAARQDCAYTALNFFNRVEDTNYLSPQFVQKTLMRDYAPVEGGLTFGDLVQLADEKGMIFHMAVYLAGDFIFTKNGVSRTEPWTIMKLADMLMLYYANREDGQILFLRKKEFSHPKVEILTQCEVSGLN